MECDCKPVVLTWVCKDSWPGRAGWPGSPVVREAPAAPGSLSGWADLPFFSYCSSPPQPSEQAQDSQMLKGFLSSPLETPSDPTALTISPLKYCLLVFTYRLRRSCEHSGGWRLGHLTHFLCVDKKINSWDSKVKTNGSSRCGTVTIAVWGRPRGTGLIPGPAWRDKGCGIATAAAEVAAETQVLSLTQEHPKGMGAATKRIKKWCTIAKSGSCTCVPIHAMPSKEPLLLADRVGVSSCKFIHQALSRFLIRRAAGYIVCSTRCPSLHMLKRSSLLPPSLSLF